jgi:hypothetical protein
VVIGGKIPFSSIASLAQKSVYRLTNNQCIVINDRWKGTTSVVP